MSATKVITACLIREKRLARGWTQQQLAERVLMTKSQIGDYENLRYIMRVSTARHIADALDCTIEELYEWRATTD